MIKIGNKTVKPGDAILQSITTKEQKSILSLMSDYQELYQYYRLDQLQFELMFRSNTMKAARELDKSGAKFTTFKYSFCNKEYWDRLENGGFLLKPAVKPSTAIMDIIKNGSRYAFECSTAIAIVLYIAALYSIGSNRFDVLFSRLYLMDWQFDEDLPIHTKFGDDYLPGDVLHFNNPDFSPQEAHWRAENVINFGGDQYFGHGIGITNSSKLIEYLNKKRKPNPKVSAYLMTMITRPFYEGMNPANRDMESITEDV
ncbi:protein-glutamine gamma-glutamyltransferase [Neobacillus muris]|uniref:protein-glutamine gamma-glutamyltransferase n=1 Tax=Neobacillus muris TaxID=2941334 RepID=UPI00203B5102|nr:protein-glutamine gamma-glutamyltransferase [Neobacillus muris]